MAEPTIKVSDNGPYIVSGVITVEDGNGNPIETKAQFALCRCGQSATKPFCDGTHRKAGFESQVRA